MASRIALELVAQTYIDTTAGGASFAPRRWSLRGRRHADAQHILIIIHRLDHRAQEEQKLCVLGRRLAGLEQVHAGVGGQGPVVVLAGTVDAGKRLFVQQADHAVARGHLLHDLHRQLVVVGSDVAGREHRRKLVLRGRHFVVLGLGVERRASRAPRPDPP